MKIAREIKKTVFAISPTDWGDYKRSLYVRRINGVITVGADDFKAWWIEWGAYNRPVPFAARAPLRRALDIHGLRYVATKK
jgi:hypothetical protein